MSMKRCDSSKSQLWKLQILEAFKVGCAYSIFVKSIARFTYSGVEGFTTPEDHDLLSRLELQLKRRFSIGSQVSQHTIVRDFMRQVSYINLNFCKVF